MHNSIIIGPWLLSLCLPLFWSSWCCSYLKVSSISHFHVLYLMLHSCLGLPCKVAFPKWYLLHMIKNLEMKVNYELQERTKTPSPVQRIWILPDTAEKSAHQCDHAICWTCYMTLLSWQLWCLCQCAATIWCACWNDVATTTTLEPHIVHRWHSMAVRLASTGVTGPAQYNFKFPLVKLVTKSHRVVAIA